MPSDENTAQDLFAILNSSVMQQQSAGSQPPAQRRRSPPQNMSRPSAASPSMHDSSPQPQRATTSINNLEQGTDRTASLLNLLRFSQDGQTPPGQQHPPFSSAGISAGAAPTHNVHGRGVSASDLVASFMGKPGGTSIGDRSPAPVNVTRNTVSPTNPQDYLLQLLNRSQIATSPTPAAPAVSAEPQLHSFDAEQSNPKLPRTGDDASSQLMHDVPVRTESATVDRAASTSQPSRSFGEIPQPEVTKNPIFTYVNPFDQLAASSPRHASRPGSATPHKITPPISRLHSEIGKSEDKPTTRTVHTVPIAAQGTSTTTLNEQSKNLQSSERHILGLGAPTTDPATVAQAFNEVSEKVSRQADFALAQAEDAKERRTQASKSVGKGGAVATAKKKLGKGSEMVKGLPDDTQGATSATTSLHKVTADVPNYPEDSNVAHADVHGSADDEKSSANGEDGPVIPVYNFVMKPFVSIDIVHTDSSSVQFRDDSITDIARLKKEFDQIDRTLATASTEYIIYSLPKSGGIRVIRQEDGVDRQVFKETKDHVFNVALSTAPSGQPSGLQTAIATATSGTVYWTVLQQNGDNLESADIKQHCLAFPPVPGNDEHTSGGQLKTRAKKSSRHPELFAIGRGRLIQIIFPLHAARSKFVGSGKVVDTEAYFKDRSLKINTGKAGKDFTFSEDDTVIATVDKAGRLRFWDVRELVHDVNSDPSVLSPIEVRTPILTLSTAVPNEKSWPTSVLFVDKLRAYMKGTALRYVIVGMKQNHTLQLWDLGIGKAIQEVQFPHSKESDAICSVCYHPASGIIVVGHPTRNSIYFIHLSAPKYNLPGMNQARFLTRLADKDSSLPKLEATAIMSGMREYSFASKGQLRSVDLLSISNESPLSKEQTTLFELYVMHSKGVTMLSIHREDLGWSDDMKVLHPINAEQEKFIRIKELIQPPTAIVSESSSVNGDVAPSTISSKKTNPVSSRGTEKGGATNDANPSDSKDRETNDNSSPPEKAEKRKKKKGTSKHEDTAIPPPAPAVPTYAGALSKNTSSSLTNQENDVLRTHTRQNPSEQSDRRGHRTDSDPITLDVSTDFIDKELKKIEMNVAEEFRKAFDNQLGILYKRIDEDRQVRDAQHGADREALLRLVSRHLGSNLESALQKIVSDSMERQLGLSFRDFIASTLQTEISNSIGHSLPGFSKDLTHAVPKAVHKALQSPDVLASLSTNVATQFSDTIQRSLKSALETSHEASYRMTQNLLQESETRITHNMLKSMPLHDNDDSRVQKMERMIDSMQDTIRSLVKSQEELSAQLAKLSSFPLPSSYAAGADANRSDSRPVAHKAAESEELQTIKDLMNAGIVEDATVKWLQSQHQAEIFDRFFVHLDPRYLEKCSPLVTLSVAAAVTASLENHLDEKLNWLDIIMSNIQYQDPDIKGVAPKIMDVLCERLEDRFTQLSKHSPGSAYLSRFGALIAKSQELGKTAFDHQ